MYVGSITFRVKSKMERFKHRLYDSHPELPLDPDSDQLKTIRSTHVDLAHVIVVAIGAFFGTLLRYEIGIWLPAERSNWPIATLTINITGAFLLGLLLQTLLHRGRDEGVYRILRLALGTGFLGAFTTYSSLAVSVVVLARSGNTIIALLYAAASVVLGVIASAFGIRIVIMYYKRKHKGAKI